MIYNYEAEILRWIHRCVPQIKLMTYASDEDLLEGLDKIKEYPSMYYSRDKMEIQWDKAINIAPTLEFPHSYTLYPYQQTYQGTILVENQQDAFKLMTSLKYYWNAYPYIWVRIPGIYEAEKELTRVSRTLLSMSVEDVRLAHDRNGSCRVVRFRWMSNLLFSSVPDLSTPEALVERVQLDVCEHNVNLSVVHTDGPMYRINLFEFSAVNGSIDKDRVRRDTRSTDELHKSFVVSCTPDDGFTFKHWIDSDGDVVFTDNPHTFVVGDASESYTAVCE